MTRRVLFEQPDQIGEGTFGGGVVTGFGPGGEQGSSFGLQPEQLLLDRAGSDELFARDDARLADAARADCRRCFRGGIPPRLEMDDGVGAGEVEDGGGEWVDLSATASSAPDGGPLSFEWFGYEELGPRRRSNACSGVKHDIVSFDQPKAWLTVKTNRVMPPGTGSMHIILAVADRGTPRLTRDQRVLIDVAP